MNLAKIIKTLEREKSVHEKAVAAISKAIEALGSKVKGRTVSAATRAKIAKANRAAWKRRKSTK